MKQNNPSIKIINIDGDDLRTINKNQDYSKKVELKIFQQQSQ